MFHHRGIPVSLSSAADPNKTPSSSLGMSLQFPSLPGLMESKHESRTFLSSCGGRRLSDGSRTKNGCFRACYRRIAGDLSNEKKILALSRSDSGFLHRYPRSRLWLTIIVSSQYNLSSYILPVMLSFPCVISHSKPMLLRDLYTWSPMRNNPPPEYASCEM